MVCVHKNLFGHPDIGELIKIFDLKDNLVSFFDSPAPEWIIVSDILLKKMMESLFYYQIKSTINLEWSSDSMIHRGTDAEFEIYFHDNFAW